MIYAFLDYYHKPLDERLKDLGHHTYSKVFNLVLKEDEEAAKSLLGSNLTLSSR